MGDQVPRILVGNISWQIKEEDLRPHLEPFGKVLSIKIPRKSNGYSKGLAIVDYSTMEEAKAACEGLKQKVLFEREVYPSLASESAPRRRGPSRPRDRRYDDRDRDRDRERSRYDRDRRPRRHYNDYYSDDEYNRDRECRGRRRYDYSSDDDYDYHRRYSDRRDDRYMDRRDDRYSPPRGRRDDSPRRN